MTKRSKTRERRLVAKIMRCGHQQIPKAFDAWLLRMDGYRQNVSFSLLLSFFSLFAHFSSLLFAALLYKRQVNTSVANHFVVSTVGIALVDTCAVGNKNGLLDRL